MKRHVNLGFTHWSDEPLSKSPYGGMAGSPPIARSSKEKVEQVKAIEIAFILSALLSLSKYS